MRPDPRRYVAFGSLGMVNGPSKASTISANEIADGIFPKIYPP